MNKRHSIRLFFSIGLFFFGSQLLNSQNVILNAGEELSENISVYYCEVHPISREGDRIKFEVLQKWDKLNSLRMVLISFSDNSGLKLQDYIFNEAGKEYLLLEDKYNVLSNSDSMILAFHFDGKRNVVWVESKIVVLDTFRNNLFKERDTEVVLSNRGQYIKFEYLIEGKFDCEENELKELLIEENLNKKIFKKWFKSQTRNSFGKLTLDEVKTKIEDRSLIVELEEGLNNKCFSFSRIEIILE